MSIARSLLREFRPLFRMLEEPLRSPSYIGALPTRAFDDPFFGFQSPNLLRPAIDVSEKGSEYVVEAELPGVKKEDVEVRIGDGGRSVTIEGKTSSRGDIPAAEQAPAESSSTEASADSANQISTERVFTRNSSFTRTVWLPRPVDASKVVAKLQDGILSLTIPKAEDKASLKVPVE